MMSSTQKQLGLLLITITVLAYWPPQLAAQTPNQAALVVRLGDDQVQSACVSFSEPQITGYELLQRSGLDVVVEVQGAGALVCTIDGVGCPANNCLCQCQGGGDCVYWSYWHHAEGDWQYSQGGASVFPVTNGTLNGWSWGPGSVTAALPPPALSFNDVCQADAAAASAPVAVVDEGQTAVSWLPYLLFTAVIAGLGFLILRTNKPKSHS